MANLGSYHPHIVHFVVALGLLGVVLRLVSLTGKLRWTRPAGTLLLVLTAIASYVAVKSGHEAHELVERIPGVAPAVRAHEELGEETRNLFIAVAVVDLIGLAMTRREKLQRLIFAVSGVGGIVASVVLVKAADKGGNLVYSYIGGPGLRTGKPEDIQRLLIAGLYEGALAARKEGRSEQAARLTDELVRAAPNDTAIMFVAAESAIRDRHDPRAALAMVDSIQASPANRRVMIQKASLQAEAYRALQMPDSATAVLDDLVRRYPDDRFLKGMVARMKNPGRGEGERE